ncbi:hypothetical protein NDU88_007917 [Pleurodeles waltl]|uniref:Uncharacterized protein n=1 Tax=Pleurodeles waltl TaxID=8319 RepID=A0AAV7RTP9_PLEWA|nr:hypothetical protein NDU88_007917 [Pleurodeles waltl]
MKVCHCEHGEKAGRLLAAQLNQWDELLAIPAIQDVDYTIITHPQDIANAFGIFYQTLYTPEASEDHERLSAFFNKSWVASLTEDDRALLEGEISKQEIVQAIAKLPYYKSPGNDEDGSRNGGLPV